MSLARRSARSTPRRCGRCSGRCWRSAGSTHGSSSSSGRALRGGSTHTYVGRKRSRSAPAPRFAHDDYITSTHRGHGHCIAKGGDLSLMMAELLGKATGYCKGKGGSMHIADLGDGHPRRERDRRRRRSAIATGAALTAKMQRHRPGRRLLLRRRRVNQGIFHECAQHGRDLEAAGHLRLREQPVRDVDPRGDASRVPDLVARAARLRHPRRDRSTAWTCSRSTRRSREAVARARAGDGPASSSRRPTASSGTTSATASSTGRKEEIAAWRERDPIERLGRHADRRTGVLDRGRG